MVRAEAWSISSLSQNLHVSRRVKEFKNSPSMQFEGLELLF